MKKPNVEMMTKQLAETLAKKRAVRDKKLDAGIADKRGQSRGKKGK